MSGEIAGKSMAQAVATFDQNVSQVYIPLQRSLGGKLKSLYSNSFDVIVVSIVSLFVVGWAISSSWSRMDSSVTLMRCKHMLEFGLSSTLSLPTTSPSRWSTNAGTSQNELILTDHVGIWENWIVKRRTIKIYH